MNMFGMGLIKKLVCNKYTAIFTFGTAVGAVATSGVLSTKQSQNYQIPATIQDKRGINYLVEQKRLVIKDRQGNRNIFDLESSELEKPTNDYQKRADSDLTELLR